MPRHAKRQFASTGNHAPCDHASQDRNTIQFKSVMDGREAPNTIKLCELSYISVLGVSCLAVIGMRDPAYPVFCAVGAVLCLLLLPWHWQARNISTLVYLGWIITACLVSLVNSLLWAGNVEDKAPIWCDISTKYIVCLNTGITAASLCVQRRLYRVAAIRELKDIQCSQRKEVIVNISLGVLFPMMMVPLYFTVQPTRYTIIEDIGCWPATYPTLLATFMTHTWPALASSASFVYAGLAIRSFLKTRRQFSEVLSESGTELTLSRYFRLMALAAIEMAFALPLSLYLLISEPMFLTRDPWISWEVTHLYINEVDTVSHELVKEWDRSQRIGIEISRWAIPGCAFLFFMFFGLSGEAIKQYKTAFWRALSVFGLKHPVDKERDHTGSYTDQIVPGTTDSLRSSSNAPLSEAEPNAGSQGLNAKDLERQSTHVMG